MKAIGYVRVSTEEQVKDGVSLEAQQAKIRAWCEAHGYELKGVHVDAGLSGGRADNRPALQAALTAACDQKAVLVVYSLSRLARSTKDALAISERLAKSGADLASLCERLDTTTASGKMIFRVLSVLAEFERDQISERTKGALSHLRSQGKRISGRIPFGYSLSDDCKSLTPNASEQVTIRQMLELRESGHGARRIAAALVARATPSKTGAPWSPQAVTMILKRETQLKPIVLPFRLTL